MAVFGVLHGLAARPSACLPFLSVPAVADPPQPRRRGRPPLPRRECSPLERLALTVAADRAAGGVPGPYLLLARIKAWQDAKAAGDVEAIEDALLLIASAAAMQVEQQQLVKAEQGKLDLHRAVGDRW